MVRVSSHRGRNVTPLGGSICTGFTLTLVHEGVPDVQRRGHMYSGPKVQSFLFSAPLFSQTNGAEKRTNDAEKRTNGAEKRTNGAEKRTNGAEKRTNGAEKRKCTLGPPYMWSPHALSTYRNHEFCGRVVFVTMKYLELRNTL